MSQNPLQDRFIVPVKRVLNNMSNRTDEAEQAVIDTLFEILDESTEWMEVEEVMEEMVAWGHSNGFHAAVCRASQYLIELKED